MMKFKIIPIGFRQRIILGFGSLILLFLGIMVTVELVGIPGTVLHGSFARYRTLALYDMELVSGLLDQGITDWFTERRANVALLSRSPFLRQSIVAETPGAALDILRELDAFMESYPEFESVAIIGLQDSSIRAASGYFVNALITTDIFISPDDLSMLTIPGYLEKIDIRTPKDQKNRLRIIRQVISADKPDKIIAILVAESNINSNLLLMVMSVSRQFSQKWEYIIAGNAGDIITNPDHNKADGSRQHDTIFALNNFPPIRLAIGGLEGPYDGPDQYGQPVLAFHRHVKLDGIGLALILKMDRMLAIEPALTFIFSQIVLWLIMFVVGMAACFIIARQISNPLLELVVVARRVESGDLTARATARSQSETALLASVFNSMIARLHTWQRDIEQLILDRTLELKKSEEKFRVVFEYSPIGLILLDKRGVVLDCNRYFNELFGTQRESFIGLNLPEKMQAGIVRQALVDALACDAIQTYEGPYTSIVSRRKLQISISTEKVAPGLYISVIKDISERKRTEEVIRKSKETAEKYLNVAAELIISLDDHGYITLLNDSGHRLLGYESGELIGKNWFDTCIYPDIREDVLDIFKKLMSGDIENVEIYENAVFTKNGTEKIVRWYNTIVRNDDGEIAGLLSSGVDITERKRAEKELHHLNETLEQRVAQEVQKNMEQERMLIQQSRQAAMGEMIGNIAHQWRQPLNALGLLLYNIKDAYLFNTLNAEYLDQAVADGSRMVQKMSTTISDFSNFFRPNKEIIVFSALKQIKGAIALVESSFLNSNISIHIDAPQDLNLMGFPNEYSQVLLNLLSNAKEVIMAHNQPHRPNTCGRVDIVLSEQNRQGCVTVRDNGGGVPAEILDRIFDPYFSTKKTGTGIGLYMSKVIIERNMKGGITVKNIEGGAEFIVASPLA